MNEPSKKRKNKQANQLDIDYGSLGKLTSRKLLNNKALIETVLTFLKSIENRKAQLETENESLKTFANAFENKRTLGKVSSIFSVLGSIVTGFAVNYATSNDYSLAVVFGIFTILFVGLSIFFSWRDSI